MFKYYFYTYDGPTKKGSRIVRCWFFRSPMWVIKNIILPTLPRDCVLVRFERIR